MFLLVLALVLVGCGVPQEQYEDLQAQLALVQQQLQTQLDLVTKERDDTMAQLAVAQNETATLQNDLASQSKTLAQTQQSVSQLDKRLNAVLDTKIVIFGSYYYHYVQNPWTLSIPLRTYLLDKEKPRPTDAAKYATLVKDADADAILSTLTQYFKGLTTSYDLRVSEVPNLVAKFTQTLPRINTDVLTPNDDYPRFPLETLFEQTADSEDASILVLAILTRLNYDAVLFQYPEQKHTAVGINVESGAGGYSWENVGRRYYYLEVTGEDWRLGDCPLKYREVRPTIYTITSP